ncbi:MAG TPA: hypothetical protein P5121_32055 [Caldilineaceae bacterium]|nr:hypothetical protein [Caldilineaceae bacterium]
MNTQLKPTLLAVDLGLHSGLALYGNDGRLRWYRSHNFGNRSRLRRGVYTILSEIPDLCYLVMEGSGPYAAIWRKEAERRKIQVMQISAEEWRPALLLERQQRSGAIAKATAEQLARAVIRWSAAPTATSLDHNAAEAILIGLWGAVAVGWLAALPTAVRFASF